MPECLDVVDLCGPPRADVDSDVLGCRFESIQGVPQMLPGAPGDQDLVRPEVAPLGFTPRFVGSLPVRLAAVPLRTTRTPRDLEPSPTPRTMPSLFCHSDAILFGPPAPTRIHTSRRPINVKLSGTNANDRTTVTSKDRQ